MPSGRFAATGLRDHHPPHRPGSVRLGAHLFPETGQPRLQPRRLDRLEALPIHPRRALVGPRQTVGMAQNVLATDLVVEQVEAEVRLRLRLAIELPLKAPDLLGCFQAHRQSPLLAFFESAPEVRVLCSAGITRPQRSYDPVRLPPGPPPIAALRPLPSSAPGIPRLPGPPSLRAVPTTPADRNGCSCRLLPHPARPSPYLRRVGVRDFTFEACSGFTRVTARWIAQPPKAAFVTGLRSRRLPSGTACQLPDQTDNCLGGTFLHW